MAHGLTPSQKRCLEFIRDYICHNDHSPTYQEMLVGLGMQSKGPVHALVKALIERGYIHSGPKQNIARGISLTDAGRCFGLVPSRPEIGKTVFTKSINTDANGRWDDDHEELTIIAMLEATAAARKQLQVKGSAVTVIYQVSVVEDVNGAV
jgi:SOS-response transcriptional repressor LexA